MCLCVFSRTLCNPMDCNLPGSSVHGISQTRMLDWVAISSSKGASQPRDWTLSPALAGRVLTSEPPGKSVSLVAQSCPTHCDHMNHSTPGLPVPHQLPEFTQTHVHWVSDAIQPSHLMSSPSPPAFNLSQHQGLFKWVSSSHQVARVLEFQLQHESYQWTPRTDFL